MLGRVAAWLAIAVLFLGILAIAEASASRRASTRRSLFPEDLPARQNHTAFSELFPDLESTLLIQKGLEQLDSSGGDPVLWSDRLARISRASVEIYEEHPVGISWEEMMVRGSAIEVQTRRVIVAHPVLDFSDALPGRAPLASLSSCYPLSWPGVRGIQPVHQWAGAGTP